MVFLTPSLDGTPVAIIASFQPRFCKTFFNHSQSNDFNLIRMPFLNSGIVLPHRTKEQTRSIIQENNLCIQPMRMYIFEDFISTVLVTANSVIFLCTTTISIISCKTNGINSSLIIGGDNKIKRSTRIRISIGVRAYLFPNQSSGAK